MITAAPEEDLKKMPSGLHPEYWVGQYADHLYAFAMARIHDEEHARDLVQETFLAALEKSGTFEGRSAEKTWLTGILKHKIFDAYRRRSSHTLSGDFFRDSFFESEDGHWKIDQRPAAFVHGTGESIERKELARELENCIQKLPAIWLAAFTMKHLEDYRSAAICRQLKITQANFWVIIHRAKVNLRACLQRSTDHLKG